MSELKRIQKIIDAHNADPKLCPYCFRKVRTKLIKFTNEVNYYCSVCERFIDLDWDYLHAIAMKVEKYSILKDDISGLDFRKVVKE
jgi:hypothetical protein